MIKCRLALHDSQLTSNIIDDIGFKQRAQFGVTEQRVGTRNMHNVQLLEAVAKTNKAIEASCVSA